MYVTSIFSFTYQVFYPMKDKDNILTKSDKYNLLPSNAFNLKKKKFAVWYRVRACILVICFNLDKSKIVYYGKKKNVLTLYAFVTTPLFFLLGSSSSRSLLTSSSSSILMSESSKSLSETSD